MALGLRTRINDWKLKGWANMIKQLIIGLTVITIVVAVMIIGITWQFTNSKSFLAHKQATITSIDKVNSEKVKIEKDEATKLTYVNKLKFRCKYLIETFICITSRDRLYAEVKKGNTSFIDATLVKDFDALFNQASNIPKGISTSKMSIGVVDVKEDNSAVAVYKLEMKNSLSVDASNMILQINFNKDGTVIDYKILD